jgi:hypothetical protein
MRTTAPPAACKVGQPSTGKPPDVDRHREHPTRSRNPAESTDGVLVAALRDRDEDAYLELLRRHTS